MTDPRRLWRVPLAALLVAAIAGCAAWTDRSTSPQPAEVRIRAERAERSSDASPLRPVADRPGAVVLSVEFLAVPVHPSPNGSAGAVTPRAGAGQSADPEAALWQWVDETALDARTRRQLAANGLRAGRLVREDHFLKMLEGRRTGHDNVVDEFLAEAEVGSRLAQGDRRIPMRFGRRYELTLQQPAAGERVTLVRLGDQLVGKTLLDPQGLLAILPSPGSAPQQVRLRLRPEIQHGAVKQSFVSSDSAIRIDTRRETWSLEDLELSMPMVEGDRWVLAADAPLRGLGQQLLTDASPDGVPQRLFVLLHLDQVPSLADRL